jgi:hypothetical protein
VERVRLVQALQVVAAWWRFKQGGGQMQLPFNDPLKRTLMSTQTPGAGVSFSQAFAGRNIPKKNFIERGLGALRNMPYAGKAFRLASSPMAATAQLGLTSPDLNVGEARIPCPY